MTTKTRFKRRWARNDGTYVDLIWDGTNFNLSINGTTVDAWSASGQSANSSLIPGTDASYDVGSASFRFRDGFFSRNVTIGGVLLQSSTDAITAHSGGGQASAVLLTTQINRLTTVAANGDSVKLPSAVPGLEIIVINSGAKTAQVFGSGTDTIDGIATAVGEELPVGVSASYICTVAGAWFSDQISGIPEEQYTAAVNTTGFTATGAQVAGAEDVYLNITGTLGAGANIQMPTAAAIVAAIPNVTSGQSYKLTIINASSANFAWTVTTNTGITLTGTAMTIAQTTKREFLVTVTSLTTVTLQSLGQITLSAVP